MCLYIWLGHFVVQQKIEEAYINCVLIKHFFKKKKKRKTDKEQSDFQRVTGLSSYGEQGLRTPWDVVTLQFLV